MWCVWAFLLLSTVAGISSGGETAPGPGSQCKEGTSWKWDCNTCTCMGGSAACTLKACFSGKKTKRDIAEEVKCVPGTHWKEDCNTCTCSELGLKACTIMGCHHPLLQGVDSCVPETVWIKNCQDCKCLLNGVPSCTPVPDCTPKEEVIKTDCQPGDRWMKDCNSCTCTVDGKEACTRKLCVSDPHFIVQIPPPKNERRKRSPERPGCTPGEVWKESCNDCHCTDQGKTACTRKLCPEDQDKKVVFPGANRRKREAPTTCTPGETWKEDCNNCFCSPGGQVACTRAICVSEDYLSPVTETSACTPNTTWNEDCNKCHCREDGTPSCTEKACKKELTVKDDSYKKNCEPGDRWKDTDCNVCRCGGDRIAICTRRLCPGGRKKKATRRLANYTFY